MEQTLGLSLDEARGLMLAAQGLLEPPRDYVSMQDVHDTIEQLGVVQVDTINVVERSQYLVLWSRLGAYDASHLDALIYPHRRVFEYWSHAASIVPMADYVYYRSRMLRSADTLWAGDRQWRLANPDILRRTLDTIHERGPMASADFERPDDDRRATAWDWYGVKDSRRALQILWTLGDLMLHSRRRGQKVYDLRERVLAEVFGGEVPSDDDLPSAEEITRHFVRRTARALGVVTPSWLWDYFRHTPTEHTTGSRRAAAAVALEACVRDGLLIPARIDGLSETAYVAYESVAELERLRNGCAPTCTTLLSPFDSLIWDRARTRALWDYDVCFEAYVVPEKRRYGYYCLAILHQGRLVGRIDPKFERTERCLVVRAAYLEDDVRVDEALLAGVADALRDLARFLGAETIVVERSEPRSLAPALRARLKGARSRPAPAHSRAQARRAARAASPVSS